MSIATDVASLEIMADVFKRKGTEEVFKKTVLHLVKKVSYIDWAGIYLLEQHGTKLVAASDLDNDLSWECNGELKFPIANSKEEQIGVLIVRSKEAIAFDVTDVSTLKTIAAALGQVAIAH